MGVSNKFALNNDNDEKNTNTTFSDELIAYLLTTDANKEYALFLNIYLNEQEFDSDALKMDIASKANIDKQIKNKKIMDSIKHFIAITKAQSNTFAIGYRFYYWQKYKEFKTLPIKETVDWNINNHGGYDVCDLFVVRKYENFKEEIMSYANITMANYQNIIAKAREHEQTQK